MDRLIVKGKKIIDQSGNAIRLRGACIGGFMNMENFIDGYPGTETGIRTAVAEAIGKDRACFLFERMLDYFFNEGDIAFLKECGANAVRIPLNYRHFESDMEPFKYLEAGFKRLDGIIDLCEKHGIYVILDLHAVQGCQNGHWHSDNTRGGNMFWGNIQFQDRFVTLWEEFARRYGKKTAVAGYNLMNEPCVNTALGDFPYNFYENYKPVWEKINNVYRRAVDAIRKIDSDTIIFLEGDSYSTLFDGLDEPFAPNLAYSSHNYILPGFGPGAYPGEYRTGYWDKKRQEEEFGKHQGTKFSERYNVPLWVGEFGSQYNGPVDEIPDRLLAIDDELDVFEQYGAHWTTWTHKDVGVMGWVMLEPDSEYMRLISDIQRMKGELGAENFTGKFKISPAGEKVDELATMLEKVLGDHGINHRSNNTSLAQAALTRYAAGLLEPKYAGLFKGMSEEKIDSVMQSFDFKNCKINTGLIEVLKKHLKKTP